MCIEPENGPRSGTVTIYSKNRLILCPESSKTDSKTVTRRSHEVLSKPTVLFVSIELKFISVFQ